MVLVSSQISVFWIKWLKGKISFHAVNQQHLKIGILSTGTVWYLMLSVTLSPRCTKQKKKKPPQAKVATQPKLSLFDEAEDIDDDLFQPAAKDS